jgi:tRNA1(Val) A37 N6-methylase TrmN6
VNNFPVTMFDDEDLCYLVGDWKLFQKIDKHRYSTDDIVTSYICIQNALFFGVVCNGVASPLAYIDIGCGIGSVLLCNLWQLSESTTAVGVEIQKNRYDMAVRSLNYNLGVFGVDQNRATVLNIDLRNVDELISTITASDLWTVNEPTKILTVSSASANDRRRKYFDLVTGTPPYFDPVAYRGQPNCPESMGCLFEMAGSIDHYCAAAAELLRPPPPPDSSLSTPLAPSLFTVCHSSLCSGAVYRAARQTGLVVLRRVDVIPREGKPSLFSVFVLTLAAWREAAVGPFNSLLSEAFVANAARIRPTELDVFCNQLSTSSGTTAARGGRVVGSVCGEATEELCVRTATGEHTPEYATLLRTLSKPSSFDKEVFDVAAVPECPR